MIFSCDISFADKNLDLKGGAKASVCALLPAGTCDSMSWENHKNTINAITTGMLASICETRNISQIEILIDIGSATEKCKNLYDLFKEAGLVLVK